MLPISRLLLSPNLLFIAHCLSFPFADTDNARVLHARQVAASATATATDIGSIVAGNIIALGDAIASLSSASVAAAATAGGGEAAITASGLVCAKLLTYNTRLRQPYPRAKFRFLDQQAGWGTTRSIWNFTLDDSVQFTQLTANRAGSSCSGPSDEQSGKVGKKS